MVKIKKNKNLKTVCFDEEIITKDSAKLLSKVEENVDIFNVEVENKDSSESVVTKRKKDKRKKQDKEKVATEDENKNQESLVETKSKRKKRKLVPNEEQNINDEGNLEDVNANKEEFKEKKSKRKKKKTVDEIETSEQHINDDQGNGVSIENPKVKTNESIRAQKKKKHAKLLEEKRLKSELVSQQNVLNYLSKWKHCRSEWKFEKLKQIWLQQNLFDTSKIPDEFWETAVEYFNGSKGFIRKVVLRDALKIIEKEESAEKENTDENYLLIVKRARDIVQYLQE